MSVTSSISSSAAPMPVRMSQGRFFRFAQPAGWGVQENGSMLCLNSPDGAAALLCVGLTGITSPTTPAAFALHALRQLCLYPDAQLLSCRPVAPTSAGAYATEFDVAYSCNGVRCLGVATVHVAIGYGQCNATLNLACARADVWPHVRGWLVPLAKPIGPANSAAFGAGRIAEHNLRHSTELGQRFREVNDYTQALHQQSTHDRWASDDRRHFHVRENLGGVQTMVDAYHGRTVEVPQSHQHYWSARDGRIVGSNDPSFDPRQTTGEDWSKMARWNG